jgi:hypothetical protein
MGAAFQARSRAKQRCDETEARAMKDKKQAAGPGELPQTSGMNAISGPAGRATLGRHSKAHPMARYGIPRRFGVNDNEKDLINWRRGLFRVWVLISVAWLMGWIIYLIMQGIQGGISTTADMLEVIVLLFGPPVALLVFGVAAGWAFRGFKIENGNGGGAGKPPA